MNAFALMTANDPSVDVGPAEKLRIAERDRFVTQQWPRIADYIELLGLDVADLLERERA